MLGLDLALRSRRVFTAAPAEPSAIASLIVQGPGALPDGADAADPNGWVARATLPAIAGATFDPTRIVLTVRDPGFENGVPVTRTRTIRGGAIVRRQMPNQTQRLATVTGSTLDVFFSLTDDIYAGSTLVAAEAEAGFYGTAAAGPVGGLLNLSTRSYPKPLACALNKPEERASGSSFAWEILAVHQHAMNGRQVDCVTAAARDESGTLGETVTVTQTALSDIQPTGLRPEVFKGTTLLGPLGQGQTCVLEWEVYPHLGDASAVLRVASDGFAWPTPRPHTPLRFLNDRTGGYGGAHAAVRIGATGGAVGASRAAAEATPYPTILAALQGVQAWNAANKGHNDHSGSTLWLMEASAGAGADHTIGVTSAVPAGKCWTEIRVSPGAIGPVRAVATALHATADKLCWMCPVHTLAGNAGIDGGGGTSRMAAFENMTLSQASTPPVNYRIPLVYWRNVHVTSGPSPFWTFSTLRSSSALVLGCTNSGSSGFVGVYACVGCDLSGFRPGEFPADHAAAITQDGALIVNCRFSRMTAPAVLGAIRPVSLGIGLVQTVFERASASANEPALQIGGDGSVQPIDNVVVHHCTVPGMDGSARANLLYTDVAGAAGVTKRASFRFNIFTLFNVKSDTFTSATAVTGRTGNWRLRYQTSCRGNVAIIGDSSNTTIPAPNSWLGDWWEPGSRPSGSTVTFVDDQAGLNRPGGGDYRLAGSGGQAAARVPVGAGALAFDLAGQVRRQDGSGAAGAFERAS